MSVLQIQRQQALRDLKMLEKQKGMAMEDPEGFARAVQRGDVRARGMSGVGPYGGGEEEEDEEEKEEMDETAQEDKLVKPEADGVIQTDRRTDGVATEAGPVGRGVNSMRTDNRQPRVTAGIAATQREAYKDFGDIPSSQNVVRMPPINWAQYHIVGESLDKLHEEQRVRPSPGQPARDEDLRPRERAPESVIAAPYNPWTDKVGTKEGRTRSSGGGGGKGGKVGKKKG